MAKVVTCVNDKIWLQGSQLRNKSRLVFLTWSKVQVGDVKGRDSFEDMVLDADFDQIERA